MPNHTDASRFEFSSNVRCGSRSDNNIMIIDVGCRKSQFISNPKPHSKCLPRKYNAQARIRLPELERIYPTSRKGLTWSRPFLVCRVVQAASISTSDTLSLPPCSITTTLPVSSQTGIQNARKGQLGFTSKTKSGSAQCPALSPFYDQPRSAATPRPMTIK
jgi:hypothetical protein